MSRNPHTGAKLQSKPLSKEGLDNWDKIFNKENTVTLRLKQIKAGEYFTFSHDKNLRIYKVVKQGKDGLITQCLDEKGIPHNYNSDYFVTPYYHAIRPVDVQPDDSEEVINNVLTAVVIETALESLFESTTSSSSNTTTDSPSTDYSGGGGSSGGGGASSDW
jgi:uncharacterized membrane protein YgcG